MRQTFVTVPKRPISDTPVRQDSCHGLPKPQGQYTRRCDHCGACFIGLAPGLTGQRGIWYRHYGWVCSVECARAVGWKP